MSDLSGSTQVAAFPRPTRWRSSEISPCGAPSWSRKSPPGSGGSRQWPHPRTRVAKYSRGVRPSCFRGMRRLWRMRPLRPEAMSRTNGCSLWRPRHSAWSRSLGHRAKCPSRRSLLPPPHRLSSKSLRRRLSCKASFSGIAQRPLPNSGHRWRPSRRRERPTDFPPHRLR